MAAGLVSSLLSSLTKLVNLLPTPSPAAAATLWPSRGGLPTVSAGLQRLQGLLLRVQATLEDAAAREVQDSSVKLWLDELRDLARDAEDVLDDHRHELLRRRAQEPPQGAAAAASRKRKYDDEEADGEDGAMGERIGEIIRRFEEISRDRAALQLRPDDGERISGRDSIWESRTSSHLLDESLVLGRTEEKTRIIELVLSCSQRTGIHVLPIVGMGGIGKTTVAQMVYNDGRVQESFDLMGWVHVSQTFDLRRLTIAITESLTRKPCGFNELSEVHRVLKKKVEETFLEEAKSVFLVLDDVWNERESCWQDLLYPLKFAKTVTILVTTRSKEVARIVQTVSLFALGSLPEDHCWLLFQRFAFGDRIIDEESSLVQVARKIMQKCGGLPLAVKSIGCLLRSKTDMQTWMEISESEFWEYSDDNEEVFSALRLSFCRLPTKLKPCFLLCTSYPKGQSFTKDDMIHLWIAHGYIQPKGCETPEKVADEYFNELIKRSLIEIDLDLSDDRGYYLVQIPFKQLNNTGQNLREFRLHDMVWDLAKCLSNHVLSVTAGDQGSLNVSNKVQHLFLWLDRGRYRQTSIKSSYGTVSSNRLQRFRSKKLVQRTRLLDFMENGIVSNPNHGEVPLGMRISASNQNLGRLDYLQVLQLRKMNYLRTLVLKCWNYELPIDIHRFRYLRALVLDSCNDRSCIFAIRNLRHLRYLHVTNCDSVMGENLKHLTDSLSHLYSLEKLIIFTFCQEFSMKSCNLFSLRYLHLCINSNDWSLHPSCHLYNLDTVCLQNCGSVTELPSFIGNLVKLRHLRLAQISKLKKFNHDFFRSQSNNSKFQLTNVIFPALEELEFDGLYDLQDWCGVQDSDCPKMHIVTIRNCCKLRRIPYFGSVRKLVVSKLMLTDLQLSAYNAPSQLQTLDIRDCQNLTYLIGLKYLCSLGSLYIARCPRLTFVGKEKLPYKPQHVFIDDCLLLKEWCDEQELYYQLPEMVKISDVKRAKELGVTYFQSFKHFSLDICPEKGPELILTPNNWLSSDLQLLKFGFESSHGGSVFSTLRMLQIRGCPELVTLTGLEELDVLHCLVITDCPSLYILSEMEFPPQLSSLIVQGCHKLLSLHLNTSDPSTFIELEVCDCKGLMYIGSMGSLSNLESLVLLHCPLLELPELLPCIPESVTVFLCPKLKKWCEIQSIQYQECVPDSSSEVDV